jgi:translation initiation factor IF-3
LCRAETCVFVRLFFYFAWRCLTISAKEKENLLNEEITAKEVRLIGADGETLGIMSSEKALETAYDQGMDLVLMSGQANPPVCKIMDYGKFRFEREKREKEAKKKQQTIELKEIQLSCRIDTHDFETKANHAKRFLADGNKVRVCLKFRGREMAHQSVAYEIMERFAAMVAESGSVDKKPNLEGRQMTMFIAPLKQNTK